MHVLLPHCILTAALEGRKGSYDPPTDCHLLTIIGEREGQRLAEVTPPSGGAPFLPAAEDVQWADGGRRLKSLQGTVCFSRYPWGALGQREMFFFLLLLSELATGRTGN